MNSPQHYSNSLTAYGVGIYGVTMQTTPWVLKPTEILDGAKSGAYSWEMVNNPILLNLFEKHIEGKINFKCVGGSSSVFNKPLNACLDNI